MSEINFADGPCQNLRSKSDRQIADQEAVGNHEKLVQLYHLREHYAEIVSAKYNEFVKTTESPGNSVTCIKHALQDLVCTFESFKVSHERYIELASILDSSKVSECKMHLSEVAELVQMAQMKFHSITSSVQSDVRPDDSISQVKSAVSVVSSRAQIAERKAHLEAKLENIEKRRRLESQKIELECQLERLKLEAEIETFDVEEQTLRKLGVDSTPKVTSSKPMNTVEHVPVSNRPVHATYFQPSFGANLQSNINHVLSSNDVPRTEVRVPGVPIDGSQYQYDQMNNTQGIGIQPHGTYFDAQRQMIDLMALPRTSIAKFDGDPLKFWYFMHTFDSTVGRTAVDDGSKLNRLFEYCTGKAVKVIQPCALMNPRDGYAKARQMLADRFGNEHQISEAWIQKVTEGSPVKNNDGESLQDFADDLRSCMETLRAMNMLGEIDSRLRMVKIVRRLPVHLQSRWRKIAIESLDTIHRYPDIEKLVSFLDRAARELNDPVFGCVPSKFSGKESKEKDKHGGFMSRSKGSSFNVHASDKSNYKSNTQNAQRTYDKKTVGPKCYLCGKDHMLNNCTKFNDMTPEEMLQILKENRLCFNCMAGHHRSRWCRFTRCETCGGKHSKKLHDVLVNDATVPKEMAKSCASVQSCVDKVALPIVSVVVKGENTEVRTHALLDPGSNRTFCSKALVNDLGLYGPARQLSLKTLNEGEDTTVTEVSFSVSKSNRAKNILLSKVLAIDKFPELNDCGATQDDVRKWKHLRDLSMPQNIEVQLLIGQDHPRALMPLEVRRGSDGEPYAVRTVLGWTINGPMAQEETDLADISTVCNFIKTESKADIHLDAQVEKFWKLDAVPDCGPVKSVDDKKVIQEWNENIKLKNGHYELTIPFKARSTSLDLPDNRVMAEKRLYSLGRRLSKDPVLMSKYTDGINDLLQKGYAERVSDDKPLGDVVWYLPHHNVINPNKPDKLRIVFDCAAEYKGVSLNKRVFQGPDLMNNLLGVLLRFRENEVAVMGDIEGMFNQVHVVPQHRDALRFLWWKHGDMTQEIEIYRMTTHLFGGVWSPSAANYALRCTANDNKEDFPEEVVSAVFENFYVDDCLLSVSNEKSATMMITQLCQLLAKGGFHLTKWLSNSRTVLSGISKEERAPPLKSLDLDVHASLPVERALGIHWNTESDHFGIQIKARKAVCTRRGLLSIMSSVYDPFGLVGPYFLIAKFIFQAECRKTDKGWDDPLEEHNEQHWLEWLEELPKLKDLQLSRCIFPHGFGGIVQVQLHHFSDASEKAYGAVSYIRLVNEDGMVHCCFLLGKSKLAPMKQLTIPRLELLAAVVAVRLDTILRKELHMRVDQSIFWTDSMIVLRYIHNTSRRFHTFVANRISAIHEETSPNQWHYVDSGRNPADNASRGLTAEEMLSRKRWLEGPEFLWHDEDSWPIVPDKVDEPEIDDKEVKKESRSYVVVTSVSTVLEQIFMRYSDWMRLQKAVMWLNRFKNYCIQKFIKKIPVKEISDDIAGPITVTEMQKAAKIIIGHVQCKVWNIDVQCSEQIKLNPGNPLRSLNPVVEDGLLKVGGRIARAPVSYNIRHPVILPSNHHITDLIIKYYHKLNGHSGTMQVLAAIRERFWIVKGHSNVKRVLNRCLHCKKKNAVLGNQQMAPLPVERLIPNKPPFTYVGVDYFGPLYVKRGRSTEKRYGCLFTCLTVRAVHIEIAHSLELDSFLCALQRFISRRGKPAVIYSDNGTNFRGGDRELRESIESWNKLQLNSTMVQKEIEWHFNPPNASHMGGVWERLIRSTRTILRTLLKEQVVTDETLSTFMAEAEKIINDRPITDVSDDPQDPEPLTPNKLLLLRCNTSLPLGIFDTKDKYVKRWWRQAQYLADVFWRRWVNEYLPMLQTRQKWLRPRKNFRKNDLVLTADENLPRGQWPLGRIVEVYPDDLGHVRKVKVLSGGTEKIRPIHKLVLLETNSVSSDAHDEIVNLRYLA